MDVPHHIEGQVKKHAAEKDRTRPRLGRVYAMITSVLGVLASDTREVFRAFFPAMGTRRFMDMHARALLLPVIQDESDEHLRERLLRAGCYMRYLGTRKGLVEFMDAHFRGRYIIIEMPKDAFTVGTTKGYQAGTVIGSDARIIVGEGLYIWIDNLANAERNIMATYLNNNTPPDVGYYITNKTT